MGKLPLESNPRNSRPGVIEWMGKTRSEGVAFAYCQNGQAAKPPSPRRTWKYSLGSIGVLLGEIDGPGT